MNLFRKRSDKLGVLQDISKITKRFIKACTADSFVKIRFSSQNLNWSPILVSLKPINLSQSEDEKAS
jgi:hypothetical protein